MAGRDGRGREEWWAGMVREGVRKDGGMVGKGGGEV